MALSALLVCAFLFAAGAQAGEGGTQLLNTDQRGATLRSGSRLMRVEICDPSVIHVVVSPTDSIPPQLVPVVIHDWTAVPFKTSETADAIRIETSALRVSIDRKSGALSYADASGRPILRELPGRKIEPKTIRDRQTWQLAQSFDSPENEFLYGLGQHQEGRLNLRGLPLRLEQVNTQISVPMLLSSRGYGLLWNNASLTEFDPADSEIPIDPRTGEGTFTSDQAGEYGFRVESDAHDRLSLTLDGAPLIDIENMWVPYSASGSKELAAHREYKIAAKGGPAGVKVRLRHPALETEFRSEAGRAIDYYFFYGPNLNQVIAEYRVATGEAPLFPRWAYGFWQCRERYRSQQELLNVAHQFLEKHIPMDVIVQDWQYWGKYGFNAMKFGDAYPQPAAMLAELHSQGQHMAITVWSKFGEDTELYQEFKQRSLLIPDTPWVDMFNPEAEKLFWQNMNRSLFDDGIDAWWLDATEPEFDPLKDKPTFLGPGEFVRDAYPFYVTRTVYDGQRASGSRKRVVILTRSAFAGQQRNAAASWSGDISGNWVTLRRQIPAGLNFSMSGLPYWTTDTGGFFRPPDQYTSEAYRELLIRWFEYGAFCPLFRIHGWQSETEMWKFGGRVETILRKYDELRYRLLPYIYSSAWAITHSGATLMRALPMDYREDPKAATISDQFLFGSDLLVNPVTEPGALRRSVYLPGSDWIDFWTGKREQGGRSIQADAPLEVIPLYVKAGAILPMGSPVENATQTPDPLQIRVYRGADGSFDLYEDEGDNYDYEKGVYSVIPVVWSEKQRVLTIGDRSGNFPGMQSERKFRIVWVRPGFGAGSDLSRYDTEISYRGNAVSVPAP